MSHVNSVRGPVDVSDLGVTLMHEHIFVLSTEIMQNFPEGWGDEEQRINFGRIIHKVSAVDNRKRNVNARETLTPQQSCVANDAKYRDGQPNNGYGARMIKRKQAKLWQP